MTTRIRIRKSAALEEWMAKEEGSFEDNKRSPEHVYNILAELQTGKVLTQAEIDTVIKSGQYHATAWEDDEIDGGKRTKNYIAKIVAKFKNL